MTLRHALLAAGLALLPRAAHAQGTLHRDRPAGHAVPAAADGRAPWDPSWAYDSGGDNDRRPELPSYQQGRGQQTGGPARNLLPDDGLHLFPR